MKSCLYYRFVADPDTIEAGVEDVGSPEGVGPHQGRDLPLGVAELLVEEVHQVVVVEKSGWIVEQRVGVWGRVAIL